jgi:N-acetylglutamate synthase-like GNAT family acetyltransferase
MSQRTLEARDPLSLTIRAATLADVEALVPMVNAAYRASEGDVFPTTTRVQRTGAMKQIDGIVVAEIDGKLAGCVHIELESDAAHFGMLATDLALQSRGVASRLIEYAESRARESGCAMMKIEVVKQGGRVPFYERRGYRIVRETDGQTWNGGQDWGAVAPWQMVDMEKKL